jgi:hypothetical protein
MTYPEFTKKFPDENNAIDFIIATQYSNDYINPKCRCIREGIYNQKYNKRFLYRNNCKSEFSILKNTIFENTHPYLCMWLYIIKLVIVSRKNISVLQFKREFIMKFHQSAWRMFYQVCKTTEEETKGLDAFVKFNKTHTEDKRSLKSYKGYNNETLALLTNYTSIIK